VFKIFKEDVAVTKGDVVQASKKPQLSPLAAIAQ
jgi:hypothetical protein